MYEYKLILSDERRKLEDIEADMNYWGQHGYMVVFTMIPGAIVMERDQYKKIEYREEQGLLGDLQEVHIQEDESNANITP